MGKIKIGDKVTIHKDSVFYDRGTKMNPKGITGVVVKVNKRDKNGIPTWFWVDWRNGYGNDYQSKDLKVLGRVIDE